MTTPTFVFEEDIFDVKDIDKEGKFFEKGALSNTSALARRSRPAAQCRASSAARRTMKPT